MFALYFSAKRKLISESCGVADASCARRVGESACIATLDFRIMKLHIAIARDARYDAFGILRAASSFDLLIQIYFALDRAQVQMALLKVLSEF